MMDNILGWNVGALLRNIAEAEVVSLYFPHLGRALVVDLRHDETDPPLIVIDGMVAGPRERMDSLKHMRPRFEPPQTLTVAPWLAPVKSMESSGALAAVGRRLAAVSDADERRLGRAYAELLTIERDEVWALIRGDEQRTRTLYQR